MKKLILAACFVVGAVTMSFAQGGGMRRSPEEQAKNLQTQLKLTDDQTTKVTAIFASSAKKMDSIRTAAAGDRDAMMKAMMPMRKDQVDKITALLTDEQKAEYKKVQEAQASRMRGGQGGGGGGGTPPPPPTK